MAGRVASANPTLAMFRLWHFSRCFRIPLPFALVLAAVHSLHAAVLSYSTTAPAPGADDVFNFAGAAADRDNIGGDGSTDGAGNDGSTYVAADRPQQGQTFLTGPASQGYKVRAIWVRHVGYTSNSASTWWRTATGGSLTVRVTYPAAASTAGFVLGAESVALNGTEEGTPNDLAPRASATNTQNGSGVWLKIALDSPVHLPPDTLCGFDLTSTGSSLFFETHGIRDDAAGGNPFAAGAAYRGSTNGAPDNAFNILAGDRVFLVELEEADAPPAETPPYAEPHVAASAFPLERVRLLDGGRFKEYQELHRTGYLAWLDPDRLLYHYRVIAGLPQPAGVTHLGGWESEAGSNWGADACRGHMLGHYLTAAAKMYAATGDASYLGKLHYLVTELKTCQDAIGANEVAAGRVHGYLAGIPSSAFTTLENNPTSAKVPFYNVHKTFAGLLDVHRHAGIDLALDVAIAMSDYHRWRIDRLSASQIEAMFRTDNGNSEEWGGMNEALTNLYLQSRARGDSDAGRHLDFARIFHRDWFIDPLFNHVDQLDGLHANTHVPQVVGFARAASVTHEADAERERLYAAADNFWRIVNGQHSLVLGGNSFNEHFRQPGKETGAGGSALSWNTAETCNTYNMLKLTGELFQRDPAEEYAAYYERALYNHILASIDPDSGMATYFVALQSGRFKTYGQPEGSCWCCTGSGIENPSVYGQHIFFHSSDTLWVNLFIPSELDWSEKGLVVRMETAFPESDTVHIAVNAGAPVHAKIRLRIPQWLAAPAAVLVNGGDSGVVPAAGSYLELDRVWEDGDVITITLPMGLHLDRSMDDPSQVSLFFGPVLLAGDLGTGGMPSSVQAVNQWDHQHVPIVSAPSLVAADAGDLAAWVRPGAGALAFTADASFAGDARRGNVDLKPFYDMHHTRYAVYWNLVAPDGASSWSGGGSSADWSDAGNWDTPPAAGRALHFGAPGGGFPVNDLTAGATYAGIGFPAAAGAFVAGGDPIGLRGDMRNFSPLSQRVDLPLELKDALPWRFDAAGADMVLGGSVTGMGSIEKRGEHRLVLLGDSAFAGAVVVAEGTFEVGDGGTGGSLGHADATVDPGARIVFHRGDGFEVASNITGGGVLVKRGPGTMTLVSPALHTGGTTVEQGVLRLGSRNVPSLPHRWSFNGDLDDSAGGVTAAIVDVGSNDATLSSTRITLAGGNKNSSDFVSLGGGLLPKDGSPATLEFWATTHGLRAWSRIFDVGASTSENLFMSWSQASQANDRVEWKDSAGTQTEDNTVAPYAFGTEYHILMAIEPGAGAGGTTRVTWFASPSGATELGPAKGSFETANTLASLSDVDFWLGRSQYADQTANASYNEVRIWRRVFSGPEREQLHDLGPDSVGGFASETIFGGLAEGGGLTLAGGAGFDLDGRTQVLGSLAGAAGSVVSLGGGRIEVAEGGSDEAVFAGSFAGTGEVVNRGTLRLVGNAPWPEGMALVNHGLLDIMTWKGELPAGFENHGTVLDAGKVKIDSVETAGNEFKIAIQGYRGHGYRLQWTDDLGTGIWLDHGEAVPGTDAPIEFTGPAGENETRRFYRVAVSP